jgi:hypothetical protein
MRQMTREQVKAERDNTTDGATWKQWNSVLDLAEFSDDDSGATQYITVYGSRSEVLLQVAVIA